MNTIKQIGIFTSGGDSPGMNAALYGALKAAKVHNIKLTGIYRGYEGMIDGEFKDLDETVLQNSIQRGGTILKSARSSRFFEEKHREQAYKQLKKKGIDAIIAVGGDGTFRGLLEFSKICSLPFIGIPGTIDNDLAGTDFTLGFDTAVNTAIQNIDKIRDTAESHNRVFLIEVMGRDSGYIATLAGLGTGADGVLIPESHQDFYGLLEKMHNYNHDRPMIIVVSEGDQFGVNYITEKFKEVNPKLDLRITILGHIQRGGSPTACDRILGMKLGVASVEAIINGEKNKMAGVINNQIKLTPFEQVVKEHGLTKDLNHLFETFYLK